MIKYIIFKYYQIISGFKEINEQSLKDIVDIEFAGIDYKDYPDFTDAYIMSANWSNGVELTNEQLDKLNDFSDFKYNEVIKYIY